MAPLLGIAGGLGVFLVWWSTWVEPPSEPKRKKPRRLDLLLMSAGIEKVSSGGLLATCGGCGLFALLAFFVLTGSPPVAVCFAIFGAWVPFAAVRWRARHRRNALRQLWPDVVDHLRSAIRAGLALPEALIQLGHNGPEELRDLFLDFGADYRAAGNFEAAVNKLKDRLADPVADRIIEALRMTREVGGSDLGRMLGTLSGFLRDSSRTRSELEARQSWTVNAARLAVAAPWIVLVVMASRPEAMLAYNSGLGAMVLLGGLLVSVFCYSVMLRVGALPEDERVFG
ncbi:type II secretion system F family protein [Paenarthrobacter aurescens]|uniref:type II secretion system F family protein n=1 Tax=Paenarthrobacter aurescens TaxID=43663 RepID=UPI001144A045|nr:type II secretion system F family protein [Paenarthrobacter aurescens]MDO6144086.1 type II secretion system F family protein [Paenarthrobacter aurescens]MDO6147933.1 type II secretion system F family protein [Paenarthrobacter aurescens]MDO6159177.1 type II secretion system F family protein [Paenarthrobacter aurescens]MDO6163161.1 type II secretion system F family protein [Paenarthrobacter aurescens]